MNKYRWLFPVVATILVTAVLVGPATLVAAAGGGNTQKTLSIGGTTTLPPGDWISIEIFRGNETVHRGWIYVYQPWWSLWGGNFFQYAADIEPGQYAVRLLAGADYGNYNIVRPVSVRAATETTVMWVLFRVPTRGG